MKRTRVVALVMVLLLLMAALVGCTVALAAAPEAGATRIDGSGLTAGTHTYNLDGGGTITLVISIGTGTNKNGNEYYFNFVSSWTSTVQIDKFYMNGGSDQTVVSAGGAMSGGAMQCPLNNGGNTPNISHIDVFKTAVTPTPTETVTPPDPTPTETVTPPDPTPTETPVPTNTPAPTNTPIATPVTTDFKG
jgi:hypothetical protein